MKKTLCLLVSRALLLSALALPVQAAENPALTELLQSLRKDVPAAETEPPAGETEPAATGPPLTRTAVNRLTLSPRFYLT